MSFKNPRSARLHQEEGSIQFAEEIRGELSLAFCNEFVGVKFHDCFAISDMQPTGKNGAFENF